VHPLIVTDLVAVGRLTIRSPSRTMSAKQGGLRLDEIALKWRDLADRRLTYFTELYRCGRWKHYYTQESFALRMLDVIKAAKVWGELADQTFAAGILADERFRRQAAPRDDHMRPAA
jgi:hypothetical protein